MTASRLLVHATCCVLLTGACCARAADDTEKPVDPAAASYSLGLYMGSQLRTSGLQGTVSIEQLRKGLDDGLGGKAASDEDKARMAQMLRDGRQAMAARNREQARQFLAQNAKAKGVVTTESGLQYVVLKSADPKAAPPKSTDRVTVRYRGRLLDGTQFDSSDSHPIPATFRLNGGMIKGWQEALRLMKPGEQWRLFVPPDLAYGDSGPAQVPPGSLLVFDLELLRIEPPEPPPAMNRGRTAPAPVPTTPAPAGN